MKVVTDVRELFHTNFQTGTETHSGESLVGGEVFCQEFSYDEDQ